MSVGGAAVPYRSILGIRVHTVDDAETTRLVLQWAHLAESRYLCVANVHVTMEAYDDSSYRKLVNEADLVVPDGMPLVWTLRCQGVSEQSRVYGPDLTLKVCEAAAAEALPVGFYGSTPVTLGRLVTRLGRAYPALDVAYRHSPPFRPLTPAEDERDVASINASGTRILFVGLGCPRQERWMAEHRGRVHAVMLGVGAAFDFHAGQLRQAPQWMRRIGLEWLFRLLVEPRRLWRRYAKHNPRFLGLVALELIRLRRARAG